MHLRMDPSLIRLLHVTQNIADTLIAASWKILKAKDPAKLCSDQKNQKQIINGIMLSH